MDAEFGKPKEECGVCGIVVDYDSSADLYAILQSLQHRGQESAGIAMSDGKQINLHKGMGLVDSVFDESTVRGLNGNLGIGHVRYSTFGASEPRNAQPFVNMFKNMKFAICHNGNIVNGGELREYWENRGHFFTSDSDTLVISHLIANHYKDTGDFFEAIKAAMVELDGSYSIMILTEDAVYAVRDPHGFRPFVMCDLEQGFAFASESCSFNSLKCSGIRDIRTGDVIKATTSGIERETIPKISKKAHCMFEYIYFARPDSVINGKSIYSVREKLGRLLAKVEPVKADVVAPVPFSGMNAAAGYARESGIHYAEILFRNRYSGRSFINPTDKGRTAVIKTKLVPIKEEIKDKDIVLVDDSIVRGTTMRNIVGMLKDVGARSVHVRSSCPPVVSPCFYGIDMQQYREFIANKKSIEEIRKFLKADTLAYNTIENTVKAIGIPKRNLCLACLNEEYPTELGGKKAEQLKLSSNGGVKQSKLG